MSREMAREAVARSVTEQQPDEKKPVVLMLQPRKRVTWDRGVVDNERMGKRSSKSTRPLRAAAPRCGR